MTNYSNLANELSASLKHSSSSKKEISRKRKKQYKQFVKLVKQNKVSNLANPFALITDLTSWQVIIGDTRVLFLRDISAHWSLDNDPFSLDTHVVLNPFRLKRALNKRGYNLKNCPQIINRNDVDEVELYYKNHIGVDV